MPCGRQIDNGQTALRQRDAGLGVRPYTVVVGSPMPEQVGHSPDHGGILSGGPCAAEKANDSAHMVSLSPDCDDQLLAAAKCQIKIASNEGRADRER